MNAFHLAIPTHDLAQAKTFYADTLGAEVGREYGHYIIFNFFGHQVVTHLNEKEIPTEVRMYPRHFGMIFTDRQAFDATYARCQEMKAPFFEDLFERFVDKPGWHFSFFVSDPSNNLIEFKYYVNPSDIFN